ncbi:MAG: hydrogenase maturation protease, partial [Chloroflexia bacterium]|nr:hydrogenase maturation protease [Chloroflexia bacterium]
TLIAGVGYRNLRDLSVGNAVIDALLEMEWPPGVEVEDLSYGPMDAIFRLKEASFERLIVVGAVARAGRIPGEVYRSRWRYETEAPELVQSRVAEAVTGVISLDNLLVICAHFEVLPRDTVVIEVEPENADWGETFSPRVARASERIVAQLSATWGASLVE